MKGFTKGSGKGRKFIPTRKKQGLKKSQINNCVSKKIPKLRHEGKPQKQSIAIAESMCRKKETLESDVCPSCKGLYENHRRFCPNCEGTGIVTNKRKKESLESDMHECTLCDYQFDKNDPDFDIRVDRHIKGRHQRHETKDERYPNAIAPPPMGNLTYGDAKFVPAKEKRKKETLDDQIVKLNPNHWYMYRDDEEGIRIVGIEKKKSEFMSPDNIDPNKDFGNWERYGSGLYFSPDGYTKIVKGNRMTQKDLDDDLMYLKENEPYYYEQLIKDVKENGIA